MYMAAHQPTEKNVALMKKGTPRAFLVAEFGQPTSTDVRDGKKYDIFRFTQGYSGGAKAGRAFGWGVADVMTLGVAELIGTPVESIADGNVVAYEVSYDKNDYVDQVISLTPDGSTAPTIPDSPPATPNGMQNKPQSVPQAS